MQPVVTQGTDRNVKVKSQLVAVSSGTSILAAQAGIVYRVVGCQISMDAAGSAAVYHGAAYAAGKVIAEGFMPTNGNLPNEQGDWAAQVGVVNETVSADVVGGNARIVLHYIEIGVKI